MPPKLSVCLLVFLLAAACATSQPIPPPIPPPSPRASVVLLPDEQGKTGAITVSSGESETLLSEPRQSLIVSAGGAQGEPFVMSEGEVQDLVGPALEALPKPPAQFIFYFKHDSAELTETSRAQLPEVLQIIRERAAMDISVVGHTDTVGSEAYNYQLSLKRAQAVATLLEAEGVDPSVLEITAHGKNGPPIPTGDQTSEPRNRRVEVTVR